MAAVHRLQQGIRALAAFSQPVELPLAGRYLSPPQMALFRQMRHSEQLHSLNVLRKVLAQDSTPDALAVAALLHDAGKSRYRLYVWQKTLAVLVRALLPRLFERWSQGNPDNLLHRPFVVKVRHAEWSAALLAAAGGSSNAVWLVAHHHDAPEQHAAHPQVHLLKRLQWADDAD